MAVRKWLDGQILPNLEDSLRGDQRLSLSSMIGVLRLGQLGLHHRHQIGCGICHKVPKTSECHMFQTVTAWQNYSPAD